MRKLVLSLLALYLFKGGGGIKLQGSELLLCALEGREFLLARMGCVQSRVNSVHPSCLRGACGTQQKRAIFFLSSGTVT